MLRIYRRLWQVTWAEQWQYRANLLMYQFYWLVSPVVYLSIWVAIAGSQGNVKGLTANDFITYYLTLLIIDQMTSDVTIYFFASKIQDGTLSGDLLRPIHPILTGALMNNLAFKALNLLAFVPAWIILFFLFSPDYSSVSILSILLALPGIALGFSINFLMGAMITCAAFWTTRVFSISQFFYLVIMLFSGHFVPLQLMPPVIQNIAGYLPFQLYLYVPVETILNRLPMEVLLRDYAFGLAWLVVFFFGFRWIWREGVKRFSAVGA
ncbi:MAG: ABC transporter permease [Anaerolineaceae bacterium]